MGKRRAEQAEHSVNAGIPEGGKKSEPPANDNKTSRRHLLYFVILRM